MPRSNEEKRALQRFLTDLLGREDTGATLAARARKQLPEKAAVGRSRDNRSNVLTRAQRDWLKTVVANEYWPKLTPEEKQGYMSAAPEVGAVAREEPSASVAQQRGHAMSGSSDGLCFFR